MIETIDDISGQVGYDIMHYNNGDIKPENSLESEVKNMVLTRILI